MPSTTPENPRKETDVKEAAIRVEGRPLRPSGISAVSSLERTPAKISIATIKPTPAPKELTIESAKECSIPPNLSRLRRTTPKTAQLVVIRGR